MRPASKTKFPFIVEELENSRLFPRLRVRPMFGSHAVYVDDKIVFILRKKGDLKTIRDDGLWVASVPEHSASLVRAFPQLRPIELFHNRGQRGFNGWLNLADSEASFEQTAISLCQLVVGEDPRIGKLPKVRAEIRPRKQAKPSRKLRKRSKSSGNLRPRE
jgi:hypothetical protein